MTPFLYPRPDLAKRTLDRIQSLPNRALAIFGPRQTGKTTFLNHDLAALARKRGLKPLYVDFMTSPDPLATLVGRLSEVVHSEAAKPGREKVRGLKALGVGLDLEAAPASPSSLERGVQLQHLFAALQRLEPDVHLLLMLDEAQELVNLKDGEQCMKAIRALFNTFAGRVLLVITGSSRDGLLRLFGEHNRASFGLADHEDFVLLGRDFVEAAAKPFNAQRRSPIDIDTLVQVFEHLEHRPADFIAFLQYLALTDTRDIVGAVKPFLRSRYPASAIRERFEALTPTQQCVLRLLAAGEKQLMGKAGLQRLAQMLGTTLTAGGVRHALVSLPSGLVANPSRGVYEIVDPQLRSWLVEQAPATSD